MQGQLAPCFVQEKLTETHMMLETNEQTLENSQIDIYGMAELVAGYIDCMEEAVNYLKDVENYSDDHPAIIGLREHLAHYQQKFVNEALQKGTESSLTMIPSLPEAISATHVEYLPLPPAYLRPIIDASRSRSPMEANNPRAIPAEHFGQRVVTKEELAKIRALRAMQQFIPINISAVPRSVSLSYFRGNDLRYAPHVRVPAAESVQNY